MRRPVAPPAGMMRGRGSGAARGLTLLLGLGLAAFLMAAPAEDRTLVGRVTHVADGDSLTVTIDDERFRIRLHQIDAPEQGQPGADAARQALADKVDDRVVRVRVVTVDDYGRLVAGIGLGERDVNRELVREGHAWAYRRYLEDRTLLADEAAAHEAGRGLWADPGPVAPWDWRRQARESAQDARPGCRIKGNVSRRGERIYHLPGDRHYDRTRIDTAAGERWFCSEAEARRAGWRHARGG